MNLKMGDSFDLFTILDFIRVDTPHTRKIVIKRRLNFTHLRFALASAYLWQTKYK